MLFSDIFRVNKLIYQRVSNWTPPWSSGRGSTWPAGGDKFVTRIPMVISWEFHRGMVIVILLYCYCYFMNNIHLISLDYRCIMCHPFIFGLHAGYPGFDPYVYIYIYIDPSSSISFIVKLKFCNGTYFARRMTIACCKALPQKTISPCEAKSQDISIHLGLFRSIMAKW
jgi:hypothetical protein